MTLHHVTLHQAAVKQEQLAACLVQMLQQQQQGQEGGASSHAGSSFSQPAAPASSWLSLSTSTSFPRNVLRRFSNYP